MVKAFATLRDVFKGRAVMELILPDGAMVKDLIMELESRFGFEIKSRTSGELDPNVKILVNGREIIYLDGIKTRLKDGDIVAFIPPVGGG
ncbi:MAG: MoaD family protein [Nitrososphaeria archaeon]|nr:MoaD family protein [Aigarchaeota archaeon]MCX8187651.1 MoaD family protein [Nitrososphaeria archaeon]MDW8021546.1 MoaD family protein [Nitrososphaerota archaeon]